MFLSGLIYWIFFIGLGFLVTKLAFVFGAREGLERWLDKILREE
jgi:hypothetical protein